MAHIKALVRAVGLDPARYSGHSLRRGGATFAFSRAHLDPLLIKALGDWLSNAFMRYCEAQEGMRLAGADAMAAATLASAPVHHAAARPRLRPLGACCAGRSSCALFSAPVHGKRISCLARERLRPFACFVCGRCCCCSVSMQPLLLPPVGIAGAQPCLTRQRQERGALYCPPRQTRLQSIYAALPPPPAAGGACSLSFC